MFALSRGSMIGMVSGCQSCIRGVNMLYTAENEAELSACDIKVISRFTGFFVFKRADMDGGLLVQAERAGL